MSHENNIFYSFSNCSRRPVRDRPPVDASEADDRIESTTRKPYLFKTDPPAGNCKIRSRDSCVTSEADAGDGG